MALRVNPEVARLKHNLEAFRKTHNALNQQLAEAKLENTRLQTSLDELHKHNTETAKQLYDTTEQRDEVIKVNTDLRLNLNRLALAFESIRTTVAIASTQLLIEGVNPQLNNRHELSVVPKAD